MVPEVSKFLEILKIPWLLCLLPLAACPKNFIVNSKKEEGWDFPGGAVVKNPPASAGHTGLSPGPGRSHMPRSN